MPAIYSLADKDTELLCEDLVANYHADLDTAGATFNIVFALRDPEDESDKPVLANKGHRVFGISKIHSLKERLLGLADAEILLDGDAWPSMNGKAKRAALDHQLQYFEVKRDKEGEFVYDDLQRPVLKMRLSDRSYDWFDAVAERHGEHSMEVIQMRRLFTESGQTYLPFVDADTGSLNPLPTREADATGNIFNGKLVQVSIHGAPKISMSTDELVGAIKGEFE
jgi:hypothetical protein